MVLGTLVKLASVKHCDGKLVLVVPSEQYYTVLDLEDVREIGGSKYRFIVSSGFYAVVDKRKVYFLWNENGIPLYLVMLKDRPRINKKTGVMELDPYDATLIEALKELGGDSVLKRIDELIDRMAKLMISVRSEALLLGGTKAIDLARSVEDMLKNLDHYLQLYAEGRLRSVSRAVQSQAVELEYALSTIDKALVLSRLKRVRDAVIEALKMLGYDEKWLQSKSLQELTAIYFDELDRLGLPPSKVLSTPAKVAAIKKAQEVAAAGT